jgi:hypothetical protein
LRFRWAGRRTVAGGLRVVRLLRLPLLLLHLLQLRLLLG